MRTEEGTERWHDLALQLCSYTCSNCYLISFPFSLNFLCTSLQVPGAQELALDTLFLPQGCSSMIDHPEFVLFLENKPKITKSTVVSDGVYLVPLCWLLNQLVQHPCITSDNLVQRWYRKRISFCLIFMLSNQFRGAGNLIQWGYDQVRCMAVDVLFNFIDRVPWNGTSLHLLTRWS